MITDLMMPGGMNGTLLAEAARELRPGLKVLLISGSVPGKSAVSDAAMSEAGVLRKSYRRGSLGRALRATLDGSDTAGRVVPVAPITRLDDLARAAR